MVTLSSTCVASIIVNKHSLHRSKTNINNNPIVGFIVDHLNQHKCGFELILVAINYFEGINFVPQSWMISRDHMLTKTIELPFNN
jgi:hypothetical protein